MLPGCGLYGGDVVMSRSSSGASTKAYSTRLASTVPAAASRPAAVTDPTERRAASGCVAARMSCQDNVARL